MSVEQAEILLEQNAAMIEQSAAILARQEEVLSVLGNIQGYAVFGVTVVLMIYAYKFLRMFF